jgi:hypothetical protein
LTSKLARQGVEEVKLPILRRDVLVASHDEGLVGVIIAQNVQLSCLKCEPLTARQDRT